jgi:ribosomal protein RSM22 (predicted rRNA methylase)
MVYSSMLKLPSELHDAVVQQLAKVPAARWMREAQALSERYRAERKGGEDSLATGHVQILGYAALILPATYAQLYGAMAAAAQRLPDWHPSSMLDIGSGPGTALWAAAEHWPSLEHMSAWERESSFITLGREMAQQSTIAALRTARWDRVDVTNIAQNVHQSYDLVVIGHVLNELDLETRQALISLAWRMTNGLLLIVEPGSEAGFAVVRSTRDYLRSLGAETIAPCVHNRDCPLENDWCHFPQRIVRPEFQRRARGAPSEWEESKFSYAAMARFAAPQAAWGRTILEASSNKAYAEIKISSQEGVSRYRALKRNKDAFKWMRELTWGELLEQQPDAALDALDLPDEQ